MFDRIKDDDNDDGYYSGAFEQPDDFFDAVVVETDDQIDDIIVYSKGRFLCNIRMNGKRADELGCELLLDALSFLLNDRVME